MMEIEQLWEEIDSRVACLPARQTGLMQALHRAAAEDILSPGEFPAFDHSSMDGFAFSSVQPGRCRVTGTIAAGRPLPLQVASGTAVRILTGACIPEGTAAIARQEDCAVEGEDVSLSPGARIAFGENIRRRGGVFRKGDILVRSGTAITPGAIALLASVGVRSLKVTGPASVLHLVTGDEVVGSATSLLPGQIHDSNGPMISALLADMGLAAESRHVPDDGDSLVNRVRETPADLLLISGGAGPGERDHALDALKSAGYAIHSSRLNSRPGKPLIFATKGPGIAFGLPGNPLSHWVCFQAFVKRAILRLHGLPVPEMLGTRMSAKIAPSRDGRRTWTPGAWDSGSGRVRPLPWKHSGDLTPLVDANALILDPTDEGTARMLIL